MVHLQQLQDEIQRIQTSLKVFQRNPEQGSYQLEQRRRTRAPVSGNIICMLELWEAETCSERLQRTTYSPVGK